MNKLHDLLLSALNVIIIIAVLAGIMLGLNKIGIFQFPDFVESMFGINGDQTTILPSDDGKIYKSLSSGKSDKTFTVTADLSPENVRQLLENVSPSLNYYQEVNVTVYSGDSSSTSKATVQKTDGSYSVSLYDSEGTLRKEIKMHDDTTDVTLHRANGQSSTISLPSADFDISDESGVVVTHERFLETQTELTDSDYSVSASQFGTIMQITFKTDRETYSQTEIYWLSLDYGIVTRAECYEGDKLVYLLETLALSDEVLQ